MPWNLEHGMSVNAVAAYEDGRKPLSKITLDDLREAGWSETKAAAVRAAKLGFWRRSEWHHSGKFAAEIDFYDPADLVATWLDLPDRDREKCRRPAEKEADVRVEGSYDEWVGQGRWKHRETHRFTGVLKGNWIHLDSGGKKKSNGNWISWREISDRS